jgi:hypothetical protein
MKFGVASLILISLPRTDSFCIARRESEMVEAPLVAERVIQAKEGFIYYTVLFLC